MHILLVEPNYYTRYPPLGLLKLATYHKSKGDSVELVRGEVTPSAEPNRIYVTSLFSYAWKPVHKTVHFYKNKYPDVEVWLGGIYASLLPDHAIMSGADYIHEGLFYEAEDLMPDYSLIPQWKSSIVFASRGCIRSCGFCTVPKLEGKPSALKHSIKHLIYPGHKRIILWDNNILGNQNWSSIFDELFEIGLGVDFNQGLDARLITNKVAQKIARLKTETIRLAYDCRTMRSQLERAISRLNDEGVRKRKIIVYTLYNYTDDPEDFFQRVKEILEWEAVSYPMRFEPPCSLEKNRYVAPKWDSGELEMVADARRVIGYAGAFPPYEGLINKFAKARCFNEAFSLRARDSNGTFLSEKSVDFSTTLLVRKRKRWAGGLDWRTNLQR